MKKSKFTEEQIAYALRQVESGTPPADVCRQLGVSEATFYTWKKKYAHLGVSELRRLRQLEDENARLKRVVADLTLDKHMLAEALRKNAWGPRAVERWPDGFRGRSRSAVRGPVGWRSSVEQLGIAAVGRVISPRCGCGSGSSPTRGRGLDTTQVVGESH